MKYSPYSFSRINVYQTCPKKFKYTYIDDFPKKPQDMTALLKGGALHHILEHYPKPSTHKLAPKYQHIINEFVQTDLAKNLLSKESLREMDIGLLSDLTPCRYNDKNAMFRGSIDYMYLDVNEDGSTMFLIDWKSGKLKLKQWQSYDQLMYYAIYMFQKYPKLNKIVLAYVYIEHNAQNSIELNRDSLSTYTNKLIDQIHKIENDKNFDIKRGPLCDWCDFQELCDYQHPKIEAEHDIGFDY